VTRPIVFYAERRNDSKLRSNDPLDPSLIYPDYLTNKKDLAVLLEDIKKVSRLIEAPSMRKWDLRLEQVKNPLCRE